MRFLLLSCNTGEGHNSTARSIMEVLQQRGIQCDLRDVLACMSPRFSQFVCNWHVRLYRYAPKLSNAGYRVFERSTPEPEEPAPAYELLALGAGKLWELVLAGNYDAVICVHVFSGMMMTEVRRSWGVQIPCFFVATDYTCSPLVEQCDMDGYFIPSAALADEFTRAGLSEKRLIPSGIPVKQVFYQRSPAGEAREKLSLPAQGVIVLLMGGSMGCGPMRKIARDLLECLPQDATLAAICGSNEKLYDSLSELTDPRMRVVGFTKDVASYMDAADLIVTKPGGLSSTEAANKHLPMVFINAVGGCEDRNFHFFLSRGFAVGSSAASEVVTLAAELAADSARRQQIASALAAAFTRNSAQEIADRVQAAAVAFRAATLPASAGIIPQSHGHPTVMEGGCSMEQQPYRQTIENLARSFAGESQARTRYTIYARVARDAGDEWIARIFEQTAANEAIHAERFLEMLKRLGGCADNIDLSAGYPYVLGETADNLRAAAAGELSEHDEVYPAFAEMARREGCDDAARLWMQIARIEGVHHNTFTSLYEQLASGTLTEKETPIVWRCLSCGYVYEGIRACDPCPVCGKPAGWQEGSLNEKAMMPKK